MVPLSTCLELTIVISDIKILKYVCEYQQFCTVHKCDRPLA